MPARAMSLLKLVNGSTGDPGLYLDYPGSQNALLFDAGENASLTLAQLADLEAVFITHHHMDHFIGFDRIMRANLDQDKVLHVFGPGGTIRKVYQRLTAYQHPFFDFQKCVFRLYDLVPGKIYWADVECRKHFAEPEIQEKTWKGRIIHQDNDLRIEAVAVEHTADCYAYAMIEKAGYHPDAGKIAAGSLKAGPWVQQALKLLREDADPKTKIDIHGGQFELTKLAEMYFVKTSGAKIAYVTDTLWSEAVQPNLIQLCKGASKLFCDSYYSIQDQKSANKHKHMTATHAAALATAAKVNELILMHFAPRYAGRYDELISEAKAGFPKVSANL